MIKERSQTFKLAFIGVDLFLSILSYTCSLILHFKIISPEKAYQVVPDMYGVFAPGKIFGAEYAIFSAYMIPGLFLTFFQVVVFVATDLYHPRRGLNFIRELIAIVRGIFINLLIVLALLFFYRGVSFSRLVILYFVAFSVLSHGAGHYFFRKFLERLRASGYNIKTVLVLGTGAAAQAFLETILRHSIYGYRVSGMLGPAGKVPVKYKNYLKGGLNDFKKIARRLNPDLIVYAIPMDRDHLVDVLDFCDSEGIDFRILPDWLSFITQHARIEVMDGLPIFAIRESPLKSGYNHFLKRLFDLTFSFLCIFMALPLFFILALIIKMSSRGPIFFSQERMGLDRKTYRMYKFRTMRVQKAKESDTTWGSKNDSRVTWIGKLLRKTSLDEIPQMINVLKGDMSIVGPRPERPHFVSQFKTKYAHYMRRHAVKSGITGWAQIQGFRGDTSIQKRVEADIYYIENWSFWLDFLIIMRTIPSMIKNPGE